MNTLKLTLQCIPKSGLATREEVIFTQEIGDVPNTAISGVKSRINQMNTSLSTINIGTINMSTSTEAEKRACALATAFSATEYIENQSTPETPTAISYFVQKIIAAELIVQETTNIYNYAQVGA